MPFVNIANFFTFTCGKVLPELTFIDILQGYVRTFAFNSDGRFAVLCYNIIYSFFLSEKKLLKIQELFPIC